MPQVDVDIHAHRQFAAMTALLIGVTTALYLRVVFLGAGADAFLQSWGAVPHKLLVLLHWREPYRALSGVESMLASLFVHPDWIPLATNIVLLLLFGASVEDHLGHYRFLLLFASTGIIAVLAQALAHPEARTAIVGAQAGVAGVAGACLAISPRGQVPTMIRGLEFPWVLGPILWLILAILLSVSPIPLPGSVEMPGLPYLLLAYGAGVALGEFYRRQRPVLLRG